MKLCADRRVIRRGNNNCDRAGGSACPGGKVVRMRRTFGDVLISVGALVVLVLMLAAFDPRVREQVSLRMRVSTAPAQMVTAGTTARDLAGVVFDAVRDESIEHAPLVLFVL